MPGKTSKGGEWHAGVFAKILTASAAAEANMTKEAIQVPKQRPSIAPTCPGFNSALSACERAAMPEPAIKPEPENAWSKLDARALPLQGVHAVQAAEGHAGMPRIARCHKLWAKGILIVTYV